jgi:hypothetical protein
VANAAQRRADHLNCKQRWTPASRLREGNLGFLSEGVKADSSLRPAPAKIRGIEKARDSLQDHIRRCDWAGARAGASERRW